MARRSSRSQKQNKLWKNKSSFAAAIDDELDATTPKYSYQGPQTALVRSLETKYMEALGKYRKKNGPKLFVLSALCDLFEAQRDASLDYQEAMRLHKELGSLTNQTWVEAHNLSRTEHAPADFKLETYEQRRNSVMQQDYELEFKLRTDYGLPTVNGSDETAPRQTRDRAARNLTPTYEGKPIDEWIRLAKTERSLAELTTIADVLESLTDEEYAAEISDIVFRILKIHGKSRLGKESEDFELQYDLNGSLINVLNKLPDDSFFELVQKVIQNGNENQRRALLGFLNAGDYYRDLELSLRKRQVLIEQSSELLPSLIESAKSSDPSVRNWAREFIPVFILLAGLDENQYSEALPIILKAFDEGDRRAIIANTLLVARHFPETEGFATTITPIGENDFESYREIKQNMEALFLIGKNALPAKHALVSALSGSYHGYGSAEFSELAIKSIGNLGSDANDAYNDLLMLRQSNLYHGRLNELIDTTLKKIGPAPPDLSNENQN